MKFIRGPFQKAGIQLLVFLLLAGPAGHIVLAEEAPKTISIASEEYPPYTSRKLKDHGIDAAIVSAAFRLVGIETRFDFFPGARSYIVARVGEMDATLPWARRKGREKDFYYSDPVIAVDMENFFFLKSAPIDWDPSSPDLTRLKGLTVAAITGHNYGEAFQNAEKSALFEVVRLSQLHQGFSMLLSGRVDAVISKKYVGASVLAERFSAEQRAKMTSYPVSRSEVKYDYLLISKQGRHGNYYLKAFNRGLEALHESGAYQRLMDDLARGAYAK
jgi:polar amino acid transport system substrate-binding protein